MEKIVAEITSKSKQANELLKFNKSEEGKEILIDIYNQINKNPKILNKIKDYEPLAYSFLLMYMDKTHNQNELKKIIELAYTCVSLGINKNESKPYNLRIAILKHGEKIFIDNIIKFWELKGTSEMYEVTAIMIFNNLLVTDIENVRDVYLQSAFFAKINDQLEEAIDLQLFHPLSNRKEIAKRGFEFHSVILEKLKNF
jgi:hypothetical protein